MEEGLYRLVSNPNLTITILEFLPGSIIVRYHMALRESTLLKKLGVFRY